VWHDSFTCVTWLIHMCDMTHSHVWHDSFTCVTWLIHMCDMTHAHVWDDSFACVTWLTNICSYFLCVWCDLLCLICVMTHSHMWHDSRTHDSRTHIMCVLWLVMSHMCHDSFTCVTWLTNTWLTNTHCVCCDLLCLICVDSFTFALSQSTPMTFGLVAMFRLRVKNWTELNWISHVTSQWVTPHTNTIKKALPKKKSRFLKNHFFLVAKLLSNWLCDTIKKALPMLGAHPTLTFITGVVVADAAYWIIRCPSETVKTRVQTGVDENMWQSITKILQTEVQ